MRSYFQTLWSHVAGGTSSTSRSKYEGKKNRPVRANDTSTCDSIVFGTRAKWIVMTVIWLVIATVSCMKSRGKWRDLFKARWELFLFSYPVFFLIFVWQCSILCGLERRPPPGEFGSLTVQRSALFTSFSTKTSRPGLWPYLPRSRPNKCTSYAVRKHPTFWLLQSEPTQSEDLLDQRTVQMRIVGSFSAAYSLPPFHFLPWTR